MYTYEYIYIYIHTTHLYSIYTYTHAIRTPEIEQFRETCHSRRWHCSVGFTNFGTPSLNLT